MITTEISSHVRYLLEDWRREVSVVVRRPLLKHPRDGLFLSTSVAKETENLNI